MLARSRRAVSSDARKRSAFSARAFSFRANSNIVAACFSFASDTARFARAASFSSRVFSSADAARRRCSSESDATKSAMRSLRSLRVFCPSSAADATRFSAACAAPRRASS